MRIELDETWASLGPALAARGHRIVATGGDLRIAATAGERTLLLRPLRGRAPVRPPDGALVAAPLHRLAPLPAMVAGVWRPRIHEDRLAALLEAAAAGDPPPSPFLTDDAGANLLYRAKVRAIDLLFVLIVGLLSPLGLLVALAVRADSPGPALFRQVRVGRLGRPFVCLKLRTMRQGTRQAGTHEVAAAQVTRLGRWLRRLKVDELPQAIAIATGEMSLVGPRPCLPSQAELVARRAARDVLALRPGITGLSQVEGIDMSDPDRLARRDADYAALRCLSLDLWLIARTFTGGGRGDRTAVG